MARTKSSVAASIIKNEKGKLKSNANINGLKSRNGTVDEPKGKSKTPSSKAKILKPKSSSTPSSGNVNAGAKLANQTNSTTQTKMNKTNSIIIDKPLTKRKRNPPASTKSIACEICGNLFRTHQNLREHVIFHHTEDGKLLYEKKKLKKKLFYSHNRKRPYLQRQALETRRRRELMLEGQKARQFKYAPESSCEEIQTPPVVVDVKVKLETYMEDNLDLKHQNKQEFKTE